MHVSANRSGDALAAIAGAAKKVEAVYTTPFLSHSRMEPMNCTARSHARALRGVVGTQNGEGSLAAASEARALPLKRCEAYKMDPAAASAGARRPGLLRQAVSIAKQVPGVPVKLIWSREEDMLHDFYRPISQCRLAAGLDAGNNLVALHIRVSGQSINAFVNPASVANGKDDRQLQGYRPARRRAARLHAAEPARSNTPCATRMCRSGRGAASTPTRTLVYLECFIDEVAQAAGKRPARVPPRVMMGAPRTWPCSRRSREAGWGKPLPAGVHRGIAQFMGYGSYSAAVAEVSVGTAASIKVHRGARRRTPATSSTPARSSRRSRAPSSTVCGPLYQEITVKNGRIVRPTSTPTR